MHTKHEQRKQDYLGVVLIVSALFWLQQLNSNRHRLSLVQSLKSESLEKTRLESCISAKLKCLPRCGKYIVKILIDVRLPVFQIPYFQNFDLQVTVLVIEIKVLFLSTKIRFSPPPTPKKTQSNKQNYDKTKQQSRGRHIGRKMIF